MHLTNIPRCTIREKYLNQFKSMFAEVVYFYASNNFDISIYPIDDYILNIWEQTWPQREGDSWDWKSKFLTYRKHCKRIDIALMVDNQLVGLLFGRISRARRLVRIDYLEAVNPNNTMTKGLVADICLTTAEFIGISIGSQFVAIRNPINQKVKTKYLGLGYKFSINFDGVRPNTMYKLLATSQP